ncbi:uncharacterized protein M421DRAFT_313676 [Didymella exigua CBS 183.55]|uniref:Uncharacterized protein n=1 Tax=Didymella exigua CBS 183.55 TaxID=1150837 RepID=A0A6A5RZ14_9PLEO|nr:uncharacterized protein M421DRAFT_313676 [Didymella exigua CBS 183.55]KAF1931496.1 hypothetical protein M421DRAFT_313676 [Didymella exigua CBS 183.55]
MALVRPILHRVSFLAPTLRTELTRQRNESMQKYILLTAQKEALQRRMSMSIPFSLPISTSSPEFQSLSSSPTSPIDYVSTCLTTTEPVPTRPGTVPQTSVDDTHTSESHKLCEINQQIVATLMELLNTEAVKTDPKYRAFIQEKLMESEQQIRRQRRRRSSNAERDYASSIAHHLELGLNTSKTGA